MNKILLLAGAGVAGTLSRYFLVVGAQRLTGGFFPVGTLLVNLVGCLLIGFLGAMLTGPFLVRDEYRIAVMVGFLGAFTTFSAFGYETFRLLNEGQKWLALANIGLNNVLGLALVWIGYRTAGVLYGG